MNINPSRLRGVIRVLLAMLAAALAGCVAVGIGRHKGDPIVELEASR